MQQKLICVLVFIDTFAVGLVNPIYTLLVQSTLIGATQYAALISLANFMALLAATGFGRLSDVHGRRAAIIASSACTLVGYSCYAIGLACGTAYPPFAEMRRE